MRIRKVLRNALPQHRRSVLILLLPPRATTSTSKPTASTPYWSLPKAAVEARRNLIRVRRRRRVRLVVVQRSNRRNVGQRIVVQQRLSCTAYATGWNLISREWLAGRYACAQTRLRESCDWGVDRLPQRREIASPLRRSRHNHLRNRRRSIAR